MLICWTMSLPIWDKLSSLDSPPSPNVNPTSFSFSFADSGKHKTPWVDTALLPLTDDFEALQAAVTAMTHMDFQFRPMTSSSLFNRTQLCSGMVNIFINHWSTTSHDTSNCRRLTLSLCTSKIKSLHSSKILNTKWSHSSYNLKFWVWGTSSALSFCHLHYVTFNSCYYKCSHTRWTFE